MAEEEAPELRRRVCDFFEVVFSRRDVRSHFVGGEIEPDKLARILKAAHAAPSVGYSQPWDFIIVRDYSIKRKFKEHAEEARQEFASMLTGSRAELFSKLKVEGILESALSIVVTYDPTRGAPHVLGRHTIPETGLYSVCLAIENLWLAARAEGIGVGWVSFFKEPFLKELLKLPSHIKPIAWLCLGPVSCFERLPDLERAGWATRLQLESLVHEDGWGKRPGRDLLDCLEREQLEGPRFPGDPPDRA